MVETYVVLPGVRGIHLKEDGHEKAHLLVRVNFHKLANAVLGGACCLGIRKGTLLLTEEVGVAFKEQAVSIADRELWVMRTKSDL